MKLLLLCGIPALEGFALKTSVLGYPTINQITLMFLYHLLGHFTHMLTNKIGLFFCVQMSCKTDMFMFTSVGMNQGNTNHHP